MSQRILLSVLSVSEESDLYREKQRGPAICRAPGERSAKGLPLLPDEVIPGLGCDRHLAPEHVGLLDGALVRVEDAVEGGEPTVVGEQEHRVLRAAQRGARERVPVTGAGRDAHAVGGHALLDGERGHLGARLVGALAPHALDGRDADRLELADDLFGHGARATRDDGAFVAAGLDGRDGRVSQRATGDRRQEDGGLLGVGVRGSRQRIPVAGARGDDAGLRARIAEGGGDSLDRKSVV